MKVTEIQILGNSGKTYTIKATANGGLHCTCASWKFQHGPAAERVCIHINFARRQLLMASA